MSHSETSSPAVEPQGAAEVGPAASEVAEGAAGVGPSCGCNGSAAPAEPVAPATAPSGSGVAAAEHAAVGDAAAAPPAAGPSLPTSGLAQPAIASPQPVAAEAPQFWSHPGVAPTVYRPRLSPALRARAGFQPSGSSQQWFGGFPVGSAPVGAAPFGVAPLGATPVGGAPFGGAPFGAGGGVLPHQEEVEEARSFGCDGSTDLVFALGELGYDFGCESRLDYFVQQMGSIASAMSPMCMAKYLQRRDRVDPGSQGASDGANDPCPDVMDDPAGHEEDANALVWTLNIDATPTFAILPDDQFAAKSYDLLTDFLFDQYFDPDDGNADANNKDAKHQERLYRVAIAGRIDGTTSLYNGTIVPVIRPVTRGMFNWDADILIDAILDSSPESAEKEQEAEAIEDFLRRIYYELR
ncbi:MAG: hypothetical protein AAF560_27120, partial [Acidobacteriota bacterium]